MSDRIYLRSAYSEIFFETSYENLQLSGMPLLPEGEGLFPTAGFDPIPYWKDVHVQVFFVVEENDEHVAAEASNNRLKDNDLDHFTMKLYPGGGYAVRIIQTNKVNEKYLHDFVRFIKEVNQYTLVFRIIDGRWNVYRSVIWQK